MSFPPYAIPANWLTIVAKYHAYAYGIPDSILPYSFTGDISANSSAQWNALTWTDARPQPDYATLSDPAFQQEALSALGGYLATFNQLSDHAQIADTASAVTSLTASVSALASNVTSAQTRTVSAWSPSLVGAGATGSQINATKDASVHVDISTSTTATIGGGATSAVTLKTCATNSSTESDWQSWGSVENDQTLSLALTLNSVQVVKSMLSCFVPAGYFVKLVNSGSGTHTETVVAGQKTVFG